MKLRALLLGLLWVGLGGPEAHAYYATALVYAHTQSAKATPTQTSSSTGVMMGLAGTITPTAGGKVEMKVCGDITTNTNNISAFVQLRVSSVAGQTAPSNGAALSGTTKSSLIKFSGNTVDTVLVSPFCVIGTVTGLTVGSAYWIDVELKSSSSGGNVAIADVDIVADELP
jgi:hypothetical protein